MALKVSSAPYQRSKKTTLQIMIELTVGLLLVWLFGLIFTFVEGGSKLGVNAILNMVVAVVVALVCDVITAIAQHKKGASLKTEILDKLSHNYSWVSAVILVLTLPAWTSLYVTAIGSVFATVVVKNFFGGFGKNIFNPAALARILITVCFLSDISAAISGVTAIAGGTVTSIFNSNSHWISFTQLLPEGYTLSQVFIGNYFGAIGETPTLLILLVGIILSIRKDINWRTPAFYLGSVALSGLLVALCLGIKDPLGYTVAHISLGGVAFGAVFMLTDPVTAPTSNFGKALIGAIAGLLTMWIRLTPGSSYPEGVIFSIALCNMISPVIDYFTVGKTTDKLPVKYGITFGTVVASMVLSLGVAWTANDGPNVYTIGGKDVAYYTTTEYQKVEDSVGIALEENHYLVERTVQPQDAGSVVFIEDTENGLAKSYQIRTNKDKLVGYVYHLSLTDAAIDNHYAAVPVKCEVWIAVDVTSSQLSIYGAKAIEAPYLKHNQIDYNGIATGAVDGLGGEVKVDDTTSSFEKMADATETSNVIHRVIIAALNQASNDLKGGN